jgi:hypothetical protein
MHTYDMQPAMRHHEYYITSQWTRLWVAGHLCVAHHNKSASSPR